MNRKVLWYVIFSTFVFLSLTNIFQKLRWSEASDKITWEATERGLVCQAAPKDSPIHKGDILLAVNNYQISSKVDLLRLIEKKNYCRYEIERDGILKNMGVDISPIYTPLSYYILASIGILTLLLAIRILHIAVNQQLPLPPQPVFFTLSLTFSGFLIFSPVGSYSLFDFCYLLLDNLAYLFFPACLLHYILLYPTRLRFFKKIHSQIKYGVIYLTPSVLFILQCYFLAKNALNPNADILVAIINHFRAISGYFFTFYLLLILILFILVNLNAVLRKKQKRNYLTLIGFTVGISALLMLNSILDLNTARSAFRGYISLILLPFLPLSLVYFLSQRRFSDIENIIKKTLSISSIFLLILGIYLFFGLNIEQNKLLGIFWFIAAVLTAGLLFKPLEATLLRTFERIFARESYQFKRKLHELEHFISTERDLYSLSGKFLDIINSGFQLHTSAIFIYARNNIFFALPGRYHLALSRSFRAELLRRESLIFLSEQEFRTKFPKDDNLPAKYGFAQFLPLKIGTNLVGLVAFGKKKDNTFLTLEDWELMASIAPSLSLAVENAFLYSELEKQLKNLSLLKEFNENIIENINLGIVVLSHANLIKTWNSFMEIRFGISREKTLNKRASNILIPLIGENAHLLKTKTSSLRNIRITINGEECTFDMYISPLKNVTGSISGKIIVFEDVTEKIHIQNQLILSEKMASLGLLSAGIAHEINTPLTGISSFCQILRAAPDQDETQNELISKIQDQVERANKITRALLDFSRQQGEPPSEINLNKVIEEGIALIEHRLKKKEIKVQKEFAFQQTFFGYPSRLQQVFINLFINAIDAMENREGLIRICGSEDQEKITVQFSDNGKGIPEKYVDKIFDPFFTTKEIGKGTGLGLSIIYNIVRDHYGLIEVQSKPGQGTTFLLSFPLQTPLRSIKI